jgi:hypothetical protein
VRRTGIVEVDWYDVRLAQSLKPATYTCPFCGDKLSALSEHALIRPLGHGQGRRHAHLQCVARERGAGRLPSRSEWHAATRGASWWSRWLRRGRAGG